MASEIIYTAQSLCSTRVFRVVKNKLSTEREDYDVFCTKEGLVATALKTADAATGLASD